MSMAAGEYVSVHSQADTETADLARERAEHVQDVFGQFVRHQAISASCALSVGKPAHEFPTRF
jgi:VIT1/CCC1 family predicted Fe2+/Mn2+ transporter